MWVLDGWTESEAIEGLNTFGYKKNVAMEAYNLCGGKIRKMLEFLIVGRQTVKDKLDTLVGRLTETSIDLAIQSTELNPNENIPDRLRTMFRDTSRTSKILMNALQVVDSSYVLNQLRERLGMEPFLKAYKLSEKLKVKAAEGLYFENLIHQWVLKDSKRKDSKSPIKKFYFSTGTAVEGVCQLSKPNMYWVPSVSNFANIDSALVLNNTLFAFQITIKASHKFKPKTFKSSFVKPVKEAFQNQLGGKGITQVVVVFVVTVPENEFTVPKSITKFLTHQVITDTIETVSCSMCKLLEKLLEDSMHT
jgi:hypothetical protein